MPRGKFLFLDLIGGLIFFSDCNTGPAGCLFAPGQVQVLNPLSDRRGRRHLDTEKEGCKDAGMMGGMQG